MTKAATDARARTYAARIRSHKEKLGAHTVLGRLKSDHIDVLAANLALTYPYTDLSDDELQKIARTRESQNPTWYNTTAEVSAFLREKRFIDQIAKTVVPDLSPEVIKTFTPIQKLKFANDGETPPHVVIREPRSDK